MSLPSLAIPCCGLVGHGGFKGWCEKGCFSGENMMVSILFDCPNCNALNLVVLVRGSSSMAIVRVGCTLDDSHGKAVGGDSSKVFLSRSQCSVVNFKVVGCSWLGLVVGIKLSKDNDRKEIIRSQGELS